MHSDLHPEPHPPADPHRLWDIEFEDALTGPRDSDRLSLLGSLLQWLHLPNTSSPLTFQGGDHDAQRYQS